MPVVGQNVSYEVNGKTLTITVDLSAQGQISRSGKSSLIASTRGNAQVTQGIYLGLNIYRK